MQTRRPRLSHQLFLSISHLLTCWLRLPYKIRVKTKESQPTMPTNIVVPSLCFSPHAHAGRTDAPFSTRFPLFFFPHVRCRVVRFAAVIHHVGEEADRQRQQPDMRKKGGNRKGGFVTFPSRLRLLILEIVSVFGFHFCPLQVHFHLSCEGLGYLLEGFVSWVYVLLSQ